MESTGRATLPTADSFNSVCEHIPREQRGGSGIWMQQDNPTPPFPSEFHGALRRTAPRRHGCSRTTGYCRSGRAEVAKDKDYGLAIDAPMGKKRMVKGTGLGGKVKLKRKIVTGKQPTSCGPDTSEPLND